MNAPLDLLGIGIGPFNLSLAALLDKVPEIKSHFFEQKKAFSWHSEIMFQDSVMQTSYLKDLVTPVDPTSRHSFLNYLVEHGLFYAHLNTGRSQVSRKEFELYCQWVSRRMDDRLSFGTKISEVDFHEGLFQIKAEDKVYSAKNLCIATGLSPWVPEFVTPHLSQNCFHAKSPELNKINLNGKRVIVVGGGQTGLEVFRNAFKGYWGNTEQVTLISRRHTLEPLDESPFTNEYFAPGYVRDFYQIDSAFKPAIVHHQRFASDGNTPWYLQELYNELYQLKHVEQKGQNVRILPQRRIVNLEKDESHYCLFMQNTFTGKMEQMKADVVILCTGFKNLVPKCLEPIQNLIRFDHGNRFRLNDNFQLDWKHSATNKIYALNFGRHIHGIAEPQTSLMAWRSGKIINDLTNKTIYPGVNAVDNFTQHGTFNDA